MQTELPVFQRFCLCLPLRCGLIIWGVFRLLLSCLFLVISLLFLDRHLRLFNLENIDHHYMKTNINLPILLFTIIVVVVDIILGVTFVMGCFMKHVMLITIYYYHNMILLGLIILMAIYSSVVTFMNLFQYELPFANLSLYVASQFTFLLAYIVLQAYVILLIRSEIIKIKTRHQNKFERKAREATSSV